MEALFGKLQVKIQAVQVREDKPSKEVGSLSLADCTGVVQPLVQYSRELLVQGLEDRVPCFLLVVQSEQDPGGMVL